MTRARLILLALSCSCLLSGRAPDGPLSAASAMSAPLGPSADIHRRLSELNPHLTAAQLARIQQAILRYISKYSLDRLLVLRVDNEELRPRLGGQRVELVRPDGVVDRRLSGLDARHARVDPVGKGDHVRGLEGAYGFGEAPDHTSHIGSIPPPI